MKKILLIALLSIISIQANELTAKKCLDDTYAAMKLINKKKITQEEFDNSLKSMCAEGCGKACLNLDGLFGKKIAKEKACNAKFPDGWACYDLSFDAKDKTEKFELQKKSCEVGHTVTCNYLAADYAAAKNYGLALKYFNISCDLGDYQACGQLGLIYARGDYGEKNIQKSYKYFKKSTKLNPAPDNPAKNNLKVICNHHPEVCK